MKPQHKLIHEAIHDMSQSSVLVDGKALPVGIANNGCRYVDYEENGKKTRFLAQNPNSNSRYAQKARNGEHITWGLPGWILITDNS